MAAPASGPEAALVPNLTGTGAIKLIGLGGVGGIVARYLAVFLSALDEPSRLVLVDGDDFEAKNASRMCFHREGNKASVTCEDLLELLPESNAMLLAVEEYVTEESLSRLVRDDDLVILAVDNHATRKLVGDFCRESLSSVCLISGGNDGVGEDALGRVLRGTCGNVQVYHRREGADLSPALDAFHPEIRDPADKLPTDLHCTELLESVPQILFANLLAASCILNAVWLHLCGALHYAELAFDIHAGRMAPVPIPLVTAV